VKFERLIGRRVDLLAVDVAKQTMQLGYRLGFYHYAIRLIDDNRLPDGSRHEPSGGTANTQVTLLPIDDLGLQDLARAAMAARRTRTNLARVVIEDSTRGPYRTELLEQEAARDRAVDADRFFAARVSRRDYGQHFTGYRLRDPKTNHTWLTFGTTFRIDVHAVFAYTPPGAPPCPPR